MSGVLKACGSLLLLAAANLAVAGLLSNAQSAKGDLVQLTPEQLQLAVGQGTSCIFYQYESRPYCAFDVSCIPRPNPADCCDPAVPDFYGCNEETELYYYPLGSIHGEGLLAWYLCPVKTTTKYPCECEDDDCRLGMGYMSTCQFPGLYTSISGC